MMIATTKSTWVRERNPSCPKIQTNSSSCPAQSINGVDSIPDIASSALQKLRKLHEDMILSVE